MSLKMTKEIDLASEKVSKIYWTFAIPSILTMILQSTAGLIDSIFIGRFVGPGGLSAITLVMPIIILLAGVGTMVGIGGTTLAGIYKGQGDVNKSNNFFNVTMVLLASIATASTLIMMLLGGNFATWIGAQGEVALYIYEYGTTLSLFFIPFLLNFAMGFFLKLDGRPIAVVIAVGFGTVINITLDFVLVGLLGMGIKGAALATGLSQLIPFIILLYMLIKKSNWKFEKPRFNKDEILPMLLNGSSELLSMASVSISGFIYNMIIIDKIGLLGVAAYAVAIQIGSLSMGFFYGFADATQSALSVNFGANQLDRVMSLRKLSSRSNFITGILMCLLIYRFGENFAGIFVTDGKTIELSVHILSYYAISYIFSGMNVSLALYYTSVNSPIISGGLTLMRSLVALVLGLLMLPMIFGENGVWSAVIFAEISTFVIGFLAHKKWPYGRKLINTSLIKQEEVELKIIS